ncbi:uncharacterized protein DEA37_0001902 [Paragonimus westermani]|uniref:Uncharacterized protein n=1 Tax=Paragonimus westermani TaxID=34504 RepID=A0A5J4NCV2_9TREM|nr:uncharacterized protein DEA37_0001902 [Paragonimus westermani]
MRTSYVVFGLLLFITFSLQSRCRGPFRPWRKNILGKHNEFRTMALVGNINGQPAASDMPMLVSRTRIELAPNFRSSSRGNIVGELPYNKK